MLHTTAGIAVKGKDGVLLMEAGKDIHLTGATLEALGDNGSLILKAGRNIHLDTNTLEARQTIKQPRAAETMVPAGLRKKPSVTRRSAV